jgi:hypothetical protein
MSNILWRSCVVIWSCVDTWVTCVGLGGSLTLYGLLIGWGNATLAVRCLFLTASADSRSFCIVVAFVVGFIVLGRLEFIDSSWCTYRFNSRLFGI